MQAELLLPTDPRWVEALDRCEHDVYHRPPWATASAPADGGEPIAVLVTDGPDVLLAPLVRRPLSGGRWDATSPYGYPGPIVGRDHRSGFVDAAMEALAGGLGAAGAVTAFLRLHPILNRHWPAGPGTVVAHAPTVTVDLRRSAEEHWAETRSGHRSDINRARRAGVTVRRDTDLALLPRFVATYRRTMERVDATAYYFFDDRYFEELAAGLGNDLHLWVAELDGTLVGASLFCTAWSSGIAQYHLSATVDEHRRLQPSKVILDEVRAWGRTSGLRHLHLGGGLGRDDDPLLRFKLGFSSLTQPFRTQRLVLDESAYRALSLNEVDDDRQGFFPAYRAGRS